MSVWRGGGGGEGGFLYKIIVCFAYCVNPLVFLYICVETCNVRRYKECSLFNLCAFDKIYEVSCVFKGMTFVT